MSRLIFVTTHSGYELVGLAKKKSGARIEGRSIIVSAGQEKVIVIDELLSIGEKPLEVKLMARIIKEHVSRNKDSEFFCAIHDKQRMAEMKRLLPGVKHLAHLLHTPGEPLYEKIKSLLKDDANMATRVDGVCSLISKRPAVSRIASIKHRIGHILLPLDIDIQGLIESDKSNAGAFDYFNSIKKILINSGSVCEDIEKILKLEKSFCKDPKEICKMLKKGKSTIRKISTISRTIDTKKASGDSPEKLKRFVGFLKKDAKSGSNKFHDWFKEIIGVVDRCYGD